MPSLNISVAHKLSHDEALLRVKRAFEKSKVEFNDVVNNLTEEWDGRVGRFSGKVMGFSFSLTVWVNEGDLTISGKYPLAGLLYKARIESEIREAAERILS